MTRINLVPVETLSRNHLIAEYRELPSVFGHVRRAQERGVTPATLEGQPAEYTLGTGHMKFFYTRLGWLLKRYEQLVAEMRERGYGPKYPDLASKMIGIDDHWFGQWEPTDAEIATSQARIDERLSERMTYKNKPGNAKKQPVRHEWDF